MKSSGDGATGHTRPTRKRPGSNPAVGTGGSRCSVVRFEKRARECIRLASLTRASRQAQGNQYGRSIARATVFKGGESIRYDPKPDDLRMGKAKRGESHVEAC